MAITDRTRKIIWARSGNKCTNCKIPLVTEKNNPFPTTVVGEECHIVSKVTAGPRHEHIADFEYDGEDNLLLLCPNCHKIIDTQIIHYTKDALKELKENHEKEVREKLKKSDPDNTFQTVDGVTILPKINTGKELLNILDGSYGLLRDHEDTSDSDEIDFIALTLENIMDYIDILSMHDELGEKISHIKTFTSMLKEIDEKGFALFGVRGKKKMDFNNGTTDLWDVAVIYMMKKDNPRVIKY